MIVWAWMKNENICCLSSKQPRRVGAEEAKVSMLRPGAWISDIGACEFLVPAGLRPKLPPLGECQQINFKDLWGSAAALPSCNEQLWKNLQQMLGG